MEKISGVIQAQDLRVTEFLIRAEQLCWQLRVNLGYLGLILVPILGIPWWFCPTWRALLWISCCWGLCVAQTGWREGQDRDLQPLHPKSECTIPSLLPPSLWDVISYPKQIHPSLSEVPWLVQGSGVAFPVMNWWMSMVSFLGGKELSSTGMAQNPSCDCSDLHFIWEDQKEMTEWAHSYFHRK